MTNPADEISQNEKRAVLRNDRLVRNTYFSQAQGMDLEMGGRFSKVTTTTVTGAGPVSYPKLPEGSPWRRDPMPMEPPLGIDINAMEPTGELHEIRASQENGDAEPSADQGNGPSLASGGSVARPFRRRF